MRLSRGPSPRIAPRGARATSSEHARVARSGFLDGRRRTARASVPPGIRGVADATPWLLAAAAYCVTHGCGPAMSYNRKGIQWHGAGSGEVPSAFGPAFCVAAHPHAAAGGETAADIRLGLNPTPKSTITHACMCFLATRMCVRVHARAKKRGRPPRTHIATADNYTVSQGGSFPSIP